ncbi:MAG: GPW/gp25 family protein [Candidatus Binataceae bacterium]|nr:GPW/gp25 family protein [Candidatus Binataceae bacterium]
MAATLANITSVDWSLKLGAIGEVVQGLADVDQCIQIILTTPKGSDPLRPTFGSDLWRYIDYPIDVAIPSAVREVTQAITLWEPRVKLVSVTTLPGETAGHLSVTVIWRLQLGSAASQTRTTSVQLPGISQP